jgi:P pilus assembly chaperone PapD
MRNLLILAVVIVCLPRALGAQGVLVAPHAIYIDHRVRSEAIQLYNPGTEPVEISVSTTFGYPVTDTTGRPTLRMIDSPDSTYPSASEWIQAFPRRVTLPPRRRQTIRLLARPPADLPDGEYWTRIIVAAKGGQVPVSGVAGNDRIQVGLTLEVRTVIALSYRKGNLTTGLSVSDLHAQVLDDSLEIGMNLERQGEGAFIGTFKWRLQDAEGQTRAESDMPLAVYYTLKPRLRFPIDRLPAGPYRLVTELVTERDDLSSDVLLPIDPVRTTVDLVVP